MKITKVSSILKIGRKSIASNQRPISVLPCFLKTLERFMCDILYSYLTKNNFLFNKQFGFRVGHLTEHALLELADQISNTFYFLYLSGIKGENLSRFKNWQIESNMFNMIVKIIIKIILKIKIIIIKISITILGKLNYWALYVVWHRGQF